jgi:hypothetical protein
MSKALDNKTKLNNIVDTGTATFAAATSVAVIFAAAEPDTNYSVFFENRANQVLWISAKTTAGFTINSSVSNSTVVKWLLIRDI